MKQKLVRDLEPGESGFIWPAAIEPTTGAVNQFAPVFDETAHEDQMAVIWMSQQTDHRAPYKVLVPAGVADDAFARMVPAVVVRGDTLGTGEDPFAIDICIADAVKAVQADYAARDAA